MRSIQAALVFCLASLTLLAPKAHAFDSDDVTAFFAAKTPAINRQGKGNASCPENYTQARIVGRVVGTCGVCEATCGPSMCFGPRFIATVDGAPFMDGRPTTNLQEANDRMSIAVGEGLCAE